MTFQGDVGGVGLADLLQSLARGRDGILTLLGREGLQATLGIEGGMVHLLADPSEDPDLWRDRARSAYVGDPTARIDSVRMTEIARAARVETVYQLLDSDTVHFKFVPGPLPIPPEAGAISKAETGFSRPASRRDQVWCAPIPVDGLLLEYARLKDEAAGLGQFFFISPHSILCLLDPALAQGDFERFARECDGTSSVLEIADRMGWSLRQMRITTGVALSRGMLREAQPAELLNLAQRELVGGNSSRASSRLIAWYESAPPGPISEADAEFLVHEWNSGRLPPTLQQMPRATARAILRRVDCAVFDPTSSARRWKSFADACAPEPVANLRVLICRIRSGATEILPPIRELLAASRYFLERRQNMRAAAFLRIAAERQPDTPSARVDLGQGFLNAGRPDEGAPWILDAARTLINAHQGEKVVTALRALVEANPSNREARRLLSHARAGAVRRKLTGKHALLIGAGLVLLLVGGFVAVRAKRGSSRKIAEVTALLNDPAAAQRMLEQDFPGDNSGTVQKLRDLIHEHRRTADVSARTTWNNLYHDAQIECARGDPLHGLRKVLALPPHPVIPEDTEPWPTLTPLYESLAARGEEILLDLGAVKQDDLEQLHAEQRASKTFADWKAALQGHESDKDVRNLEKHLAEFQNRVDARGEERATARAAHLKKENLAKQDLLLASARAHAQAGDHKRSLDSYRQLVDLDTTGKLAKILAPEIQIEEKRAGAIEKARELAAAGKHAEAKKVLSEALENGGDYLLPWNVETVPAGARAKLKDGTVRVTPFTLETAFGEKISMVIEKEGCDPVSLDVDTPADRTVYLTSSPERSWHPKGRVEALPLSIGEDHILCSRSGEIARLNKGGTIAWEKKIESLGGIARTPALLPKDKGKVVILTEDGDAWLCDVSTGALDGPLALGSPPVAGPITRSDGAQVRLRDGRSLVWTDALSPSAASASSGDDIGQEDADPATERGSMVALRRTASGALSLKSPWTGWTVEVGPKACMLIGKDETKPSITIRREGTWNFVAWEAPRSQLPRGRLWFADGGGVRSYVP
jgi:hypothetical protein